MNKSVVYFLILISCIGFAKAQDYLSCKNPTVSIVGPLKKVFTYRQDKCGEMDFPDSPAMAFKDASGQVHLFNGNSGSYMSVGATLDSVKRQCSQPFFVDHQDNAATPESFDNLKWLRDTWTFDGKTIYALVHNEFHGWQTQPKKYCPSKLNTRCWYPNLLAAKSIDSGKNFKVLRDKQGKPILAIVTPYPYEIDGGSLGHQRVIQQQTNIVTRRESNGKLYFYILAIRNGDPTNPGGTCLIRSDNISNPASWRAWDGSGFNMLMNKNAYRDPNLKLEKQVCKVILKNVACTSWTYNTVLKQYIAICNGKFKKQESTLAEGFMYVLSKDMLHWSKPYLLTEINFKKYQLSRRGSGISAETYPSILDPKSPGLNFEFSGKNPLLYFTRFNPKNKGSTWHNRDLLATQLEVSCGK